MSISDGKNREVSKVVPFPWHAFPPYVEWAIGYGSAIFPQSPASAHPLQSSASTGKSTSLLNRDENRTCKKMTYKRVVNKFRTSISDAPCRDYLLLVPQKDLLAFHQENLTQNPTHYAWPFRIAGPQYVCTFQQAGRGVEVFYNTLLYLDHGCDGKQLSKYGVATIEDFQAELGDWSSLFFSGRLHKPVRFYSSKGVAVEDSSFWPRLKLNRLNAIRAALFLNPGTPCPVKTLLTTICGLSYTGDIRVGVAENPRKLENIVAGQTVELLALYYGLITKHFPQVRITGSNISSTSIERLCHQLTASCLANACISPVWEKSTSGSASSRGTKSARCGSTQTDYDTVTYDILREDVMNGQLLLEVPKADEGRQFRAGLLDSLPRCVQEDVWKRAYRRKKATRCPNILGKGSARLFPLIHSFQGSRLTTQDPSVLTRTSNSSTQDVLPNTYPCSADLLAVLTSIVRRSSMIISLKSALTAGPSRMVAYGLRKLAKRWLPS